MSIEQSIYKARICRCIDIDFCLGRLISGIDIVRVGTFNLVFDGGYLTYSPGSGTINELQRQPEQGRFTGSAADMVAASDGIVTFGLDVQAAIEAPRIATQSFPSSFAPFTHHPGLLQVEARIDPEVRDALADLGHRVDAWPDWTRAAGSMCALAVDPDTGAVLSELTVACDQVDGG